MISLQEFKDRAKASGDLFLPSNIKKLLYTHIIGTNQTLLYVSYWSILHFLSGCLLGLIIYESPAYYWIGLIIHTLWELWQKFIGMTIWNLRGGIDTIMDSLLFVLGMFIVHCV
jgi:hypothetical protein